ncbi:MAG TPA: hypothetical protein VG273_10805 [Bryobacteraceae bacterium]|jgi:hypothetical protein|nr:hypothetical protein [Bryobacteraceae bacterium]
MKNAFLRIGYTCVSLLALGGGLLISVPAASAAIRDVASVKLAQPVMVGSTMLPGGEYTITDEGNNVFLVHSNNGDCAMVYGRQIEADKESPKTEVILKNDGEMLRLDELRFQGQSTALEFNH